MIPFRTLRGMKGSVVRVEFNQLRPNYTLTGVLELIVINKLVLRMEKNGNIYRINMKKVSSVTELDTGITVLNLQDGPEAALSLTK